VREQKLSLTELTVEKEGGGGICKLGICDSVIVNMKWAFFPPVLYGRLEE
jgi:hypothetical protein